MTIVPGQTRDGQLFRGNSPWGSPAFPTNEFAEHRRQRKRRIVIDYRKVNNRTLRAVYYVRRSDDVKAEVAGSVFMTFLDAAAGFNQVVNTPRARRMLAIVARSGQFLPVCLTFGPVNIHSGQDLRSRTRCEASILLGMAGLRR